jgi:hypothetical protein
MRRREFVQQLMAAVFAAKVLPAQQAGSQAPTIPAPVPWTLGLNPKTPLPHTTVAEGLAQSRPRFFTQAQMDTLVRLSDLLLPRIGDKPGAIDAQTPQFLDFLIGVSGEPRKKVYTSGLNWLGAESQRKYKKPFAQLDKEQASALVKPWLRMWMSDHPPTEEHADFINIAHDDIREATVNSKPWSAVPSPKGVESTEVALYWTPIDPDIRSLGAGASLPPHVQAAPKSGQTLPIYRR